MTNSQKYFNLSAHRSKIALANLVELQEGSEQYRYVATRIYDATTDAVTDEVLDVDAAMCARRKRETVYGVWGELPKIDIATKKLVEKNRERYCTLMAARVCRLGDIEFFVDSSDAQSIINIDDFFGAPEQLTGAYRVLGHEFIDINGDKQYFTVAQLRKSDILRHTHSTSRMPRAGGLYTRMVTATETSGMPTLPVMPLLESVDTDTTVEDAEVSQSSVYKLLVGGWYTIAPTGTLLVDKAALAAQQLEHVEVPNEIRHIPKLAFSGLQGIKTIKLPESLYSIGDGAFKGMTDLEDINIPSQVEELEWAFDGCKRLRCLDLSGVKRLAGFSGMAVEHLILPDSLDGGEFCGTAHIGTLEFRGVAGEKRRLIKAKAASGSVWHVGTLVTNGPVLLGDYGVIVKCLDVKDLETSIVGIVPKCSFSRVNSAQVEQPWICGAGMEVMYASPRGGYQFTEAAFTEKKLRTAYVNVNVSTSLPKSVAILQGQLSNAMLDYVFPNVVYASCGVYRPTLRGPIRFVDTAIRLPSLRWLLPYGKVLPEAQVLALEKKLTAILPELCAFTEKVTKLDLMDAKNLAQFKVKLLHTSYMAATDADSVIYNYGMIYVGDYSEVLGKRGR